MEVIETFSMPNPREHAKTSTGSRKQFTPPTGSIVYRSFHIIYIYIYLYNDNDNKDSDNDDIVIYY